MNPEFATVFLTISGVMFVNLHFNNREIANGISTVFSLYWQKLIEGGTYENKLGVKDGRGDSAGDSV